MRKKQDKIAVVDLLYIIIIVTATVSTVRLYVNRPAWAKPYRGTMQSSLCVSNLKKIGNALSLYCEDNGGRYPSVYASCCPPDFPKSNYNGLENSNEIGALPWVLRNYTRDSNIWMCPAGPRRLFGKVEFEYPLGLDYLTIKGGATCLYGRGLPPYVNYVSVAFNANDGAPDNARGLIPDQYAESSKKIKQSLFNPKAAGNIIMDFSFSPLLLWVHGGGCNVLFYDGRVEWISDPKAYPPK